MVKQQGLGNLKGKVNFCMPWTSSSHSIDWEYPCSSYSPKWSWFRQNPTVEVGNNPFVTKHNTWVLPSARLKALCKGRMHHSPHFIAGEREAQPMEEPCMAEPRFTILVLWQSVGRLFLNPSGIQDPNQHLLMQPPVLRSTTFQQGPKVCSSHLGLHRLFCWRNWVTDADVDSSTSVTLSGANANFPHCTWILRIIPF